jgi:hypothetical protein
MFRQECCAPLSRQERPAASCPTIACSCARFVYTAVARSAARGSYSYTAGGWWELALRMKSTWETSEGDKYQYMHGCLSQTHDARRRSRQTQVLVGFQVYSCTPNLAGSRTVAQPVKTACATHPAATLASPFAPMQPDKHWQAPVLPCTPTKTGQSRAQSAPEAHDGGDQDEAPVRKERGQQPTALHARVKQHGAQLQQVEQGGDLRDGKRRGKDGERRTVWKEQ